MTDKFPLVSCVVIGINSSKTISQCINSIKNSDYKGKIEIIYVDGGSTDNTIRLVNKIKRVKIIQLNQKHPTPGRQRNAGWKAAKGNLVHFFDGDVIVEKDWISTAVKKINSKKNIGAVCGLRKEKYPNKNFYHMVADLEWDNKIGITKYFGGDVLIKKKTLNITKGYDSNLIAGEDPELSFRIRKKGYKLIRLKKIMCYHDINMGSFKQYFKRGYRNSYGHAEVGLKLAGKGEKSWAMRSIKHLMKTSGSILLLILGFVYNRYILIFPLMINGHIFLKVPNYKKKFDISYRYGLIYSFHLLINSYIILLGIMRYFIYILFNYPLTNKNLKKVKKQKCL